MNKQPFSCISVEVMEMMSFSRLKTRLQFRVVDAFPLNDE